MNGSKKRWKGCLLFLLFIVALPCFFVWHERREERLSAQLLVSVRDLQILSIVSVEPEDDKDGHVRANLKQQGIDDEARVVRLLQEGADPNVRELGSVQRTSWEEIKFLVTRMFKRPSASVPQPPSALAIAVQAGDTVSVTALLKAGANDIHAEIEPNSGGRYPLVNFSAFAGNLEIVQELCAKGADIHRSDYQGMSALRSALGESYWYVHEAEFKGKEPALNRNRRTEIFHVLLAKGARYQANSKEGYDLLYAAVDEGFLELTQELLASGVSPNAQRKWLTTLPEYTLLDAAVEKDNIALATLLLQHGASTQEKQAEPPMPCVKSVEMARLLLQHGADPNDRGSEGLTAIQLAKLRASPSSDAAGIVALLKDYGAKR